MQRIRVGAGLKGYVEGLVIPDTLDEVWPLHFNLGGSADITCCAYGWLQRNRSSVVDEVASHLLLILDVRENMVAMAPIHFSIFFVRPKQIKSIDL